MDVGGPPISYASWGQRFGAWLLDIFVVWTLIVALSVALFFAAGGPDDDPATDDGAALGVLAFFPGMIITALYFALMHGGKSGQTLGKKAAGIAVRRQGSLERISYGQAFGRAFIFGLFWLLYVWILDILWPLWDERKQALHDKVVGSVVVHAEQSILG